jgi:hypothetical protein
MADITYLQGTVGPASAGVGESHGVTLTRNTGLRVGASQASLQDAVERGSVFAVANQAGVTSQAGLSATTPVLTLANPSGSGKNLVLWYAGANMLVANAAAAAVFLAAGTDTAAAAVTGTLTTAHRNLKLGASNNPAARTFLAATLPAAPVAIAILGAGLTGAITTTPSVGAIDRWFNGSVILKPGTNISIQTSTASGASGLLCEFIWEEVDE